MALLDGGGHLGPQRVHDAYYSNQSQVLLHLVLSVLLATPLLSLGIGLEGHKDITVGDGKRPTAQLIKMNSNITITINNNITNFLNYFSYYYYC